MKTRTFSGLCKATAKQSALVMALIATTSLSAHASSHREAPATAGKSQIDGTDLYMFQSYEPGREGYTTILANYVPGQDPLAGRIIIPWIRMQFMKSTSTITATR